jgi:hypothetical protein
MAPLYPGNADRLVGNELTRHQRLRITATTLTIQPETPYPSPTGLSAFPEEQPIQRTRIKQDVHE